MARPHEDTSNGRGILAATATDGQKRYAFGWNIEPRQPEHVRLEPIRLCGQGFQHVGLGQQPRRTRTTQNRMETVSGSPANSAPQRFREKADRFKPRLGKWSGPAAAVQSQHTARLCFATAGCSWCCS